MSFRGLIAFCIAGFAAVGQPAPAGAAPERIRLDRVVAVVNDDVVLKSEVENATERHPLWREALATLPKSATPLMIEQKRRDVRSQILDELINKVLVRAEAEKFQITATQADVDRALPNVAAQYGLTVEELRQQVEAGDEYASWQAYRDELRDDILQFRTSNFLASWSVSEAQIREHYRKMTRDEGAKVIVEQLRFSPKTQQSADRDRAFAQAQISARKLRAGEATAKVAAAAGIDGDTERAIGRGEIAPALENSIFAAKQGAVVGPLASGQGYVVFKIKQHKKASALSYEEAKDRIRNQLESEAFLKAEQEFRRQLRAKAHVDIRL